MPGKLSLVVITAIWLSYVVFAAGYYANTFALFNG